MANEVIPETLRRRYIDSFPAKAAAIEAACEALAKLYEHQLRNPEQALVYTRQGLLLLSEPCLNRGEAVQSQKNALQYRYARLRHKLANEVKPQEDL